MTGRVLEQAPSRRFAFVATVATAVAGLVASGVLVWHASYSAFSATTTNPTDNWAAGSVALTDDDSGSALFTVANMKPGATGTKCIVVTSNASLASTVKLYATAGSFAQTKTLADNISLTVTQGASTGANCAGFAADTGATNTTTGSLTAFSTSFTAFSSGFGTWAPAAGNGVQKTYQITYTLNNAGTQAATDAMQGGTAQIGFTWEEQTS
ncbi:MAG TPA: hypothetical protein VIG48_08120 [Jatrophihabitans sp.]|jgi:hypothetical protein